jgi:hypothetical protein
VGAYSLTHILHGTGALVCLAKADFPIPSICHPGDPSLITAWGGPKPAPSACLNHIGLPAACLADAPAESLNSKGSFVWVRGGSVR